MKPRGSEFRFPVPGWLMGLRALIFRRHTERELDEELRAYLDAAIEQKMASGMSRGEATRAARAAMGSIEAVKDDVREAGWESTVESVWRDAKHGMRLLTRSPGFTAVTVITLALGIGANTAVFSVAHALLLQSLPYPEPEGLVAVVPAQKDRPAAADPISYPTFLDWQAQSRSFESLAAYVVAGSTLTGLGDTDAPVVAVVTPNVFPLLGTQPLFGRTLLIADGEPGAPRTVVISERFWRDRLGARSGIVGQHLTLDGAPYAIVGVMPSSFRFPHSSPAAQLWMPLTQFRPFEQILTARAAPFLIVVGRLEQGRGLSDASTEMQAIAERLAQQHREGPRDQIVRVVSLQERVLGDTKSSVLLLVASAALLLLIACTNVASLQLARTVARTREMVVRASLGAGRARLLRQILIESLLLALVGGAAGLLVAQGIMWALRAPIASELSLVRDITIDRWVLAFTFVVSCVAGILFGLLPILGSSWIDLSERLRSRGTTGDRRHTLTQNVLVVLEVALALVLLTSAGLLIRSLVHLQRVDPGFTSAGLLTGTITLPQSEYATQERWQAFNAELLDRLRRLPGVEDAAFGVGVPFLAPPVPLPFAIEGDPPRPEHPNTAEIVISSSGFFEVMQIPLVRGRPFAESDTRRSVRVAIVNRAFARRYFGDRDPVGRAILLGAPKGMRLEVVGVVGDTAHTSLVAEPPALLHLPYNQRPFWITSFFLRTTGDPQRLAGAFRREVTAMAPSIAVLALESMDAILRQSFTASRHRTLLLGLLSGVALILAAVGMYGLLAYTVARRTNEIGIRLALGAAPPRVRRLVILQGLRLTLAGMALGLAISLAVTRFLEGLLFRVSATDPLTAVGGSILLVLVTLVACYVPARRATNVDPLIALRTE